MKHHSSIPLPTVRLLVALTTATGAFFMLSARATGVAERPRSSSGLGAIFTNGAALDDTNDDTFADAVLARVIVPAAPASEDIETAVNIAARLGHETMALTLPVVLRENEVADAKAIAFPILVGRGNAAIRRLAESGALDTKSLTPGQGLIAWVSSPLGGPDGVAIVGADDEGTLAAGLELAGHLPRAWSLSGITLPGIEDQGARLLRGNNVTVSTTRVTSIIVDAGRRGLAAVTLQLGVPDADAARAARVLEDLDVAHRRGQEPRTLNFTSVAETRVDLVHSARNAGRVVVRRAGLNGRTLTPPIDPDELATDSPGERGRAAETTPVASRGFDLTGAYSVDGWFGDGYADLIPDRVDSVLILGPGGEAFGASHIAARLGLESTGVTLPLSKVDAKVRDVAREPSPILIGRANSLVQQLVKIGKARLDDLQPGEGVVQMVPRAFGPSTATVVAGADDAGTEAASLYLGRRVPYVWDVARGAPALRDVVTDATRFFQAKSAAGQAALAVRELDAALLTLKDKSVDSLEARVFLDAPDPQLAAHLSAMAQGALKGAAVKVSTQGVTEPVPVFEEKVDIPWEVDDFWTHVRGEVIPKVTAGAKVDLEARLSESPAVRKSLADQVRETLTKAGAANPRVRILSAYKQGFLWLTEEIIPALKNKGAKSVHVNVATYKSDLSKKYKFYTVPTRWLHELYLADEIFQRELGLPKESFTLELVDSPKDIYTLDAKDAGGRVIHHATFSPTIVEREYLDKFPGWTRVPVWTGHITASVNGTTVSDARIATDPERFWDHYQGKVLPRIYDHVMRITDNAPMPDKQPFHRDLDVEVWMSEPDFKIGLDEELISSLESLHEDLYFVTLDFFDALGRTTVRRRLAAPGKIYPIIHPERPNQAGQARILYAGNASTKPKIEISYHDKGTLRPGSGQAEKPQRINRDLARIESTTPTLTRAVVKTDRVRELHLQIEARDDREASRAVDALDALARLHEAGLYRDALSYEHVDRVAVEVGVRDARARRTLVYAGASARSNVRSAATKPAPPLVKWDHIISPDESEEIVGRLAAFPEVRAYRAGHSYRGRDISILEITAPVASELVSLAKATTFKPTILITGRQHANEVSSTSHILRLGELLVTDPAYREMLKRVNVILHPVENPDGAQMAYDLQKLTPAHMLHAGRYSALGMDVASQVGLADPLLPESRVRMSVWRDWLPDIYLNPHGYPAHEWVQQFAGYVPPGFRIYLSSRGWYTSVNTLRDPRYAPHARATEAIREAIVREINSNPDVRAMNLRHQARYRRWAFGFQPFVYNQEIYKDTAIYYSDPETGEPSGNRRAGAGRGGGAEGGAGGPDGGGGGRASMNAWPQVTYFSGGTETPDETAQGAWLDLVTKPGFSYLMASLKYLRDGQYQVDRIEEDGQRDAATRTWFRQRPVMPGVGTGRGTLTNGQ
ncbi:MAG: hypothetical protein HYS05_19860 [Acidobacteria bacterium]|nr:hypothetical protein [Acidobacteriota bacterium]